ncbi:DotU/TssL family secretion system protein [Paraburkholderia sediminicola]|uniref:DotU/TssL family secretion system protein n=1 Tax=Paraburkholderia sediminicola TaxID=458836 RepID=UPI0038BA6927
MAKKLSGFLLPVLHAGFDEIRSNALAMISAQGQAANWPSALAPSLLPVKQGLADRAAPLVATQVLARPAHALAVEGTGGEGYSRAQTAQDVPSAVQRFESEIARARAQAIADGYREVDVADAVFAVVACLDEYALTINWPGQAAWRDNPLQRRFYNTVRAGALFYERLDALLLGEDANPEVLETYALVLIAGFGGALASQSATLDAKRRAVITAIETRMSLSQGIVEEREGAFLQSRPRHLTPAWRGAIAIGAPLFALGALYFLLLNGSIAPMVNLVIRRF